MIPGLGRRKWQPTPVFLPGKSHGWRSLAGYSPWGGGVVTKSLTRRNDFTFKHSGLSEQLPELSVLVSFPGYVPCISQALCSISPGKKQISVFWNTWYTLFASSPRTLKAGTLLCSAGKILRRGRIDLVGLLRIYVIF